MHLDRRPLTLDRLRKLVLRKKGFYTSILPLICYVSQMPLEASMDDTEAFDNRVKMIFTGTAFHGRKSQIYERDWLTGNISEPRMKKPRSGEFVFLEVMSREVSKSAYDSLNIQVCSDMDNILTQGGCINNVRIYPFVESHSRGRRRSPRTTQARLSRSAHSARS